nr:hypothetical protein [Tanacetum cinerariifolium]
MLEEFPLAEQFPTANEDKLPLLSQSDATAEELCAAIEVKEQLSVKDTFTGVNSHMTVMLKDPISGNIKWYQSLVRSFDQEKNNIQAQQKKKMVKSSSSLENEACSSKTSKKNTDSLNSKITELTNKLSDSENMMYYYKLGLSQVEARLVEFKNQEVKYCEKIRGLKFKVDSRANIIESLTNEIDLFKKEKEGLDSKLTGFQIASKDLDSLLENQRSDKNKEGLGYNDTVTDYSRPSPAIESTSDDLQNRNPSVTETGASPSNIVSKTFIKFVKATGNSQNHIDDKGYWDSGCSRHMTGNISYLSDYEPFDRGYVSFGQGGCKITGKGTIKTDCIVLGRDFKLIDDTNVLLRTPRQHNMYFIDLNNIVPHKYLTCLVAKASADECMLWHRRLGKQHKASCKTKLVNSVTKPLYTLHMDLFGPTSDETSGILRNFIIEIENPKERRVKIIRCDNQGEFRNKEMNDFCSRKEAARTMLADAKLPVTFWAKAVNTACYVQNRVLVNKSQNKTPYELFNHRTPTIGFLKPFGCHVMILNTLDNLGKFDANKDGGYFIGYSMSSKAFRVFNKRTKRVEENLHVDFLENKAIEKCTKEAAGQDVKKDVSSLRYIALPNWVHEALLESSSSNAQDTYDADASESSGNPNPTATKTNPPTDQMETLTVETPIPTISSPVPIACLNDSPEPSSDTRLISKRVTSQDDTPSLDNILTLTNRGVRPIGTKWVLKNKKDERGIVIINKARLVAQGHTQEEGIDYDEVFTLVTRIKAIRLFLAYASFMGFTVYQMDVKIAFLYGTIDEEVYVMQPPGFQNPEFPARVYKVEKAIPTEGGWHFSLSRQGKDGTGKDVDLHLYRSMIGSLMYLTTSRPDIMFVVCACARHQVTPKECHLHAVKSIFRYLKGNPKLRLWYPKESPFDLVAYSYSDYGGASQDYKSTTEGCQFLDRILISWQCKKQTIVATSTTEAEYVAAPSGCG